MYCGQDLDRFAAKAKNKTARDKDGLIPGRVYRLQGDMIQPWCFAPTRVTV
jgi:hypothetical protein